MKIEEKKLRTLYQKQGLSAKQISTLFHCSEGRINYWIRKFSIQKRSIAESTYLRLNPNGDPFKIISPRTKAESILFGVGIGLYWGEGTKKNLTTVRLGNTDPYLAKIFLSFLHKFYAIEEHRLRFGLQIFSDMDTKKEESFWCHFLHISSKQLYKTTVTISESIGTYREKSKHGVLTIYFHNKKLRDILVAEIERFREVG